MPFAIVIMAAGKGTRLKSKRPKVVHEIGGKPLLLHVIEAALKVAPAEDIFVVTGHQGELVRKTVAATGVRFVEQKEQRGTGDAIASAREAVSGYENLLVLSGDVPLLRPETIVALRDAHLAERADMTVLTAVPENPHGYGRVKRRSGTSDEIEAIIEQKALRPEMEGMREINTGIYAFAAGPLFEHLGKVEAGNAAGEYYLTDMAHILKAAGGRVLARKLDEKHDINEVLGANTIAEMMELDRALRRSTAARLMAAGVTIFQPETVVIDAGVEVGADSVIEPFVQLLGTTRVGGECVIRSYSVLENAVLGDGVMVRQGCVVTDSRVGDGALIGPYAHLRPETVVGEQAHVGNFVELKKATLGDRSKANHLAYLGDVTVGTGTNIGAGTIISNYDGREKHHTEIGSGAFIGSNAVLVAPVSVGDGAYVAASSCITDAVPDGALGLGRARQVNKEGWAERRGAGVKKE